MYEVIGPDLKGMLREVSIGEADTPGEALIKLEGNDGDGVSIAEIICYANEWTAPDQIELKKVEVYLVIHTFYEGKSLNTAIDDAIAVVNECVQPAPAPVPAPVAAPAPAPSPATIAQPVAAVAAAVETELERMKRLNDMQAQELEMMKAQQLQFYRMQQMQQDTQGQQLAITNQPHNVHEIQMAEARLEVLKKNVTSSALALQNMQAAPALNRNSARPDFKMAGSVQPRQWGKEGN